MTSIHPDYRYESGEQLPVEVLVFRVPEDRVEEFLVVDHEVWTLGEALLAGLNRIPFRSKEVWLNDKRPGIVTIVFVWESHEEWDTVGAEEIQHRLQDEFDAKFPYPVELLRAYHEDYDHGIHRVSRFERCE